MKIFPCDQCNVVIGSPEGLAAHKAIRHDKKWNKEHKKNGQLKWLDPEEDDNLESDDFIKSDMAKTMLFTNYRFC